MEHVSQLRGKKRDTNLNSNFTGSMDLSQKYCRTPSLNLSVYRGTHLLTDSSRRASFQGFKVQLIVLVDV